MTNVLVTGGAGYVGSHACKALASAGYLPITYDSLVHGHDWAVKWGPLELGDVLDQDRLRQVIKKYRPEAVLHFAAFAYVGESVADPGKYYRNNVLGTLTLLDAMRAENLNEIVFSSTCATYGVPKTIPIAEDSPQNPINPYGASKLMVEQILADYGTGYGLKSVSLRYFNAAGADAQSEIGEDHDPETHLIPLVLDAASGTRSDITIFGEDYETPDGTCIRDYVHVSDIAEAHVLALKKLRSGVFRRAYNLGTGTGVSVAEIIAEAKRITGRDIRVVNGPRRAGDPARLVADPSRAREDLGWAPRHPAIGEVIESAWRWNSQRRNSRGLGTPRS